MIICDSLGLLIVTDFIFLKNIFFFYLQCIVSWCIVQRNTLTYYFHRFSKPRKCFAFCVIWRSLRRVTSFCDTLKLCPFHCVPPLHTRSSCAHSQLLCTLAAPVHTRSSCAHSQWSRSSAWPLSVVPISFALSSCCCAVMFASVKGVPGEVPPSYNFHIHSHVLAAFLSIPGNMVVLLSILVRRTWVHS